MRMEAPGKCGKCRGTGVYGWGAYVASMAKMKNSGTLFFVPWHWQNKNHTARSMRNRTYNVHKINAIASADFHRDPAEDASDRWNEQYR